MSSSGWEAMRPLNASDRVEDVQVENALDAPLRRGVELARLALVASLGGFARGYDAVVAATAVAQARDEFSAGRWLDYTAPGVAALGALAGAAFGGVASDAFGRKRVAFVCDALFIAGACLALRAGRAHVCARAAGRGASPRARAPRTRRRSSSSSRRETSAAASSPPTRWRRRARWRRDLRTRRRGRRSLWRVLLGATAIPAAAQAAGMFWCPSRPRGSRTRGHAGGRAPSRRAGVRLADLETPARARVPGAGYGVSGAETTAVLD